MVSRGGASIDDILLLFIYLEMGAMVGIYFKTVHLPVRYLIYIAITALTRLLLGSINHKHESDWTTLITTGSILILAISVFVIRYASARFPSEGERRDGLDEL
jgi:protein PsiE